MASAPAQTSAGRTLLHAQRLERIDAGGAAGGNPAGEERDTNHEHRDEHGNAERPRRRLVAFHRRDHAHATDAEREADDQADDTEAQTVPHEQRDDLATLGTERCADADLADPLPDRERNHGVEADGREQERERAGPASGGEGGDDGTPFRRFDGRERTRGNDGQCRRFVRRRGTNRRQQLFGRTVRANEEVTGRVHARLVGSHDVIGVRERG